MIARPRHLAALALLSAALLSGCALIPSGPMLIDPDEIADTAEEALEDAYDVRYRVDCGNDDVELDEGENVDCIATNRDTDLEYDAEVEITELRGAKYEIEVELSDEANNADEFDEGEEDQDESSGDAPTVPGSDIASLATTALAPVIGFEPEDMVCLSDEVQIFVDNIEYCGFTTEDGGIATVEVTVTTFDAASGDYEIHAEIVD